MKSANWISAIGNETVEGGADGDSDDGRLGERRVQHAGFAEARVEAVRRSEHPPFAAHVLAHDEHPIVPLHLLAHGGTHRLDHPHFGHLTIVQRHGPRGTLRYGSGESHHCLWR